PARAPRRPHVRAHVRRQLRARAERARRFAGGHGRHSGSISRRARGGRMLSVLKVGGSVLRDEASYAATARFLHERLAGRTDERLVVIVSAQYGATDELL